MHRQKYKNLLSGFTLLEIMIVIAIVGIMAAIAFPSYTNMVKNNCLTTKTNTLVSFLQLARSEAVKRQQNVTITQNGGDWATGWTITDASANVIKNVNSTICPVTSVTGSATSFTYAPTGFINTAGTLTLCDDRTGEVGRRIDINLVGRPHTERLGC